jgi:hypothetical protein
MRDDMPSLDHDTLPLAPITISDQQGDTLHRRLQEPYIVRGCAPHARDQIYYYGCFRPTREEVVRLNSWDRRGSFEYREWIQWASSGISWSAHIIGQNLSKRYPQDHNSITLERRGGQPIAYNRPDMDALSNIGLAIATAINNNLNRWTQIHQQWHDDNDEDSSFSNEESSGDESTRRRDLRRIGVVQSGKQKAGQ